MPRDKQSRRVSPKSPAPANQCNKEPKEETEATATRPLSFLLCTSSRSRVVVVVVRYIHKDRRKGLSHTCPSGDSRGCAPDSGSMIAKRSCPMPCLRFSATSMMSYPDQSGPRWRSLPYATWGGNAQCDQGTYRLSFDNHSARGRSSLCCCFDGGGIIYRYVRIYKDLFCYSYYHQKVLTFPDRAV